MSVTTAPGKEPRLVLRGVGWQTYQALRNAPENYNIRMTYDEGVLELISPSIRHERFGSLIDRFIDAGVTKFAVRPACPPELMLDQLEILGREVVPAYHGAGAPA